jgi:tetratricopeptide (TPR) repeat protein
MCKSVHPGINVIPADLVELAGTAFYQLGDWESARKEFERITQMTYSRQEFGDIYAKSFYWLGKICEQLGKSKEAGENFERFLDLWKNADPGLPETEDTRTRLNSLR